MSFDFRGWVRQPSTILGFGTIGGLIASAFASYEGGAVSGIVAAGALVFALVHLAMPDNSQAAADAQKLAIDLMKGVATHSFETTIPQMFRDGMRFVTDMNPKGAADGSAPVATAQFTVGQAVDAAGAPVVMVQSTSAVAAAAGPLTTAAVLLCLTGAAFGLAACGTPAQQQAACQTDAGVQPLGAALLTTLVPASDGVVSLDTLLVHPAVVKYCAGLGGTPAAVPASAAPPSIVPAVPVTPAAAN